MDSKHLDLASVAFNSAFTTSPASTVNPLGTGASGAPSASAGLLRASHVGKGDADATGTGSVEVMILWGSTTLFVKHLTPPRSFYVGEREDGGSPCDFLLPAEKLGVPRVPMILVDEQGIPSVVLLAGATGTIELTGQGTMTVAEVVARGIATPCGAAPSASQVALPAGSKARIELGGLTFQFSSENAVRSVAGGSRLDRASLACAGISFAVHASLLGAMAFFMPRMEDGEEGALSQEQTYVLQQYLRAAAEREGASEPEMTPRREALSTPGGSGVAAMGDPGSMGSPMSRASSKRFAVAGPSDNPNPQIAKEAALAEARSGLMIGLLRSGAAGDPNAPTAPWGRDESLGNDPISARGNMWGPEIGESYGAGGLGLTGVGESGGGSGLGMGVGRLGTIGHGDGMGTEDGFGNGRGRSLGRLAPSHTATGPRVTPTGGHVIGRIPPEIVQRIVRQNFGRLRVCYENGLRSNPALAGRVAVRFVIGREGAVVSAASGGSDLADASTVSCVVQAFYGLSFPRPENGIVTVTYPIMFTPGS